MTLALALTASVMGSQVASAQSSPCYNFLKLRDDAREKGNAIAAAQKRQADLTRSEAMNRERELEITAALDRAYDQYEISNQQVESLQAGSLREAEAAVDAARSAYKFGERGIVKRDIPELRHVLAGGRIGNDHGQSGSGLAVAGGAGESELAGGYILIDNNRSTRPGRESGDADVVDHPPVNRPVQ